MLRAERALGRTERAYSSCAAASLWLCTTRPSGNEFPIDVRSHLTAVAYRDYRATSCPYSSNINMTNRNNDLRTPLWERMEDRIMFDAVPDGNLSFVFGGGEDALGVAHF